MKKAKPNKDLKLDYKMRSILNASAVEFKFEEKLDMVAIHVPTVGVIVTRKGDASPSRCWTYPAATPFKDALSKTFENMLNDACENAKKAKKE